MVKKRFLSFFLAVLICLGLGGCVSDDEYKRGYNEGYEDGRETGYDIARDDIQSEFEMQYSDLSMEYDDLKTRYDVLREVIETTAQYFANNGQDDIAEKLLEILDEY